MASISRIVINLPEVRVPVTQLQDYQELPAPERGMIDALGIRTICDATGRGATDLAVEATRELLERFGELAPPAAFILVGSRAPELLLASESTRAQRDAGLPSAIALGVSDLGCVTISAALKIGLDLLTANPLWAGVVVAHGSRPIGSHRFRSPVTLTGDGGSAMYLSHSGPFIVRDLVLETDGEYWDLFRLDYRDVPSAQWREVCTDMRRYSFSLAVESRKRFARMNEELLSRQNLTLSDVDHFVLQNVSIGAYDFYEQAFDISFAQVCRRNLGRYGHLGGTDIALNLEAGLESAEFQPGDLVLVMNNAPVAAWSTMLVEIAG